MVSLTGARLYTLATAFFDGGVDVDVDVDVDVALIERPEEHGQHRGRNLRCVAGAASSWSCSTI